MNITSLFAVTMFQGKKCRLKFDTSDTDNTDDQEQLKKKKKKRKVKQHTGHKGKSSFRDGNQVSRLRHQLKNSNCEIFLGK